MTVEVNQPLWIYTEAAPEIGAGHVVRCSAYAAEWAERGHPVRWLLRGDAQFAREFIGLEAELSQIDWLRVNVDPPRSAVCIVDSYSIEMEQIAKIGSFCRSLAIIDDECRLPYARAIVVHTSPGPVFPMAGGGGAVWALGPNWQPLRRAFTNMPKRVVRPEVKSILIVMGGSDLRNLSAPMALVAREAFPSAHIRIVGGMSESGVDGAVDHFPLLTAERLSAFMQDTDIAISAAGQTTFELAAAGLPSVLVAIAKNQAQHIEHWPAAGAFVSAGWWDDQNFFSNVGRALETLRSASFRQLLSERGQSMVDGRGAERLYRLLNHVRL
ncbi:UDP-2,4-diacetamido-2,4,6-trideoxy-beta-L-altropyranose hydrolase [Sinorhizobium fredii]